MKCVLITGCGHSGTRLLFNILSKHTAISSPPEKDLNGVMEFTPMHHLFIDFQKRTEIDAEQQFFDIELFNNCMQRYISLCDTSRWVLWKQPYYPLLFLKELKQYFGQIKLVFTNRPKNRVLQSFERRGEHNSLFNSQEKLLLQLKKFDVKERKEFLADNFTNGLPVLGKMYDKCIFLRDEWGRQNPKNKFINFDMQKLNEQYLVNKILELGLPPAKNVKNMIGLINKGRL